MTNDEIRAIKTAAVKFHAESGMTGNSSDHICALLACVETLLAREAEVIAWLMANCTLPDKIGYDNGAKLVSGKEVIDAVTTILSPQPAALAEEKTNAD